jgi:hypothetical protein
LGAISNNSNDKGGVAVLIQTLWFALRLVVGLSLAYVTAYASDSSSRQLPIVIEQLRSQVDATRAMGYMRQVWETDRWFTFPKFQETAETLQRTMKNIGLRDVELLGAPADGVTQVGYWTVPLAWDVKSARLEIVEPTVSEELRVLADYGRVPVSLGMWSGPTPPDGLIAEVIEANQPPDSQDWKGKMVLTRENPANMKWLLVQKGAAGAINAFTENPDLKDDRQWINAWGDRGWGFTKDNVPLPCFSISPRQRDHLRKLLAEGRPVRVKAIVDSRYFSGVYPYVTGRLPGTGSEEVLVLGHTSEQGAHDNATGVAAMLEALGALNQAISSGKLPQPRRSIRILTMGEMYGSMHYVSSHPERVKQTVAALCIDTPAASYEQAGTEYTFYFNPHAAASFVDAFILKVANSYYGTKRPFHSKDYTTGTDTYLSDPMIGIPTVWPYSGTGVHTHHNSADRPETVDPRSLRDLTILSAAYLYYLASAGDSEAGWLAELALTRGQKQIVDSISSLLDSVPSTDAQTLAQAVQQGQARIEYSRDRAQQAVRSVSRLLSVSQPAWIGKLEDTLSQSARLQMQRLESAVQRRATELGVSRIQAAPEAADPWMEEARKLIVKRKRFGTLPLDDVAPDQREGQPNGAWADTPVKALYWCDGRRTLAEVVKLTQLEVGSTNFDLVKYFRFLEKKGYVEFVTREEKASKPQRR